ncbi:hypothetical protein [Micromonospora sp. DT63]|uniref:hypothetical protein n=1 Tax=Micromonospora sp. DT63 TaxID=3393441 RepID=UPI003CF848E6
MIEHDLDGAKRGTRRQHQGNCCLGAGGGSNIREVATIFACSTIEGRRVGGGARSRRTTAACG